MKSFKRYLVALDFSSIDSTLIRYVAYLASVTDAEKVYFVHIAPSLTLPRGYKREDLGKQPIDEYIKQKMKAEVAQYFKPTKEIAWACEVEEGNPLKELLHWAEVKQTDLLLVGKKKLSEGSGIVAQKLARKATCSVLFVMDNTKPKIQKIAVPLDFSKNSGYALEEALLLYPHLDNAEIMGQHAFDVPNDTYYDAFKTLGDFELVMLENARSDFKDFIKDYNFQVDDVNFSMEYSRDDYMNPAKRIFEFAQNKKADLIAIGAKGHSLLGLFFMGSVTEKLLVYNDSIPVLVVKDKK